MPLQLLISEMRRLANLGTEDSLKEARMIARDAAPYAHPRLQAIMANVSAGGDTLTALLSEIDGLTTGISQGAVRRPALEARELVPLSDEERERSPVPS